MGRPPRRWTQLTLQAQPGTRGGVRRSSGRKKGRTTVARTRRPRLSGREVLHVTLRLRPGAPPLHRNHTYRTLRAVFRRGKDRFGFRLAHYSVQSNHLHLICEANDRRALSRGMQGLAIRIARNLNRIHHRRGRLFADRYHLRVLASPTEVRRTLLYVLRNAVHHGVAPSGAFFDTYSSAPYFSGWKEPVRLHLVDDGEAPVTPPTVWLLMTGWRRGGGELSFNEEPRRDSAV